MSKPKISSPYSDLNRHPMFQRSVNNPVPADTKVLPGEKRLYLVLPFGEPSKSEKIKPTYRVETDAQGHERAFWDCPHCGMTYVRRRPCMGHMGMIPNVPSSCAGKRIDRR